MARFEFVYVVFFTLLCFAIIWIIKVTFRASLGQAIEVLGALMGLFLDQFMIGTALEWLQERFPKIFDLLLLVVVLYFIFIWPIIDHIKTSRVEKRIRRSLGDPLEQTPEELLRKLGRPPWKNG